MKHLQTLCVTAIAVLMQVMPAYSQLPGYIPKDGLVAYLPLNGNTDDASGKGSLFENTAVDFDTVVLAGGVKKIYGVFNGTDEVASYLLAKDATRFMTEQYSYTIQMQLKQLRPAGASKTYQGVVCLGAQNWTWGPAYNLYLSGLDNTIVVSSHWNEDPSLSGEVVSSDNTAKPNEWIRVVVVYDGVQQKMYIDGKLIGKSNSGISYSHHDRFIIGANADNPDGRIMAGFNGNIDDFAFWNRALSESELDDVFSGKPCNLSIPSDSILGYRNVETHQVVTYALRNDPALSYKWIATGGYMLGASTNHFCDVIWGYDKNGSVCCIVSDSTCSDTVCVTTTINNKTTGGIAGGDVDVPTMSVKPNPAADMIDISTALGDKHAHFELVDVTGVVVQRVQGIHTRMSVSDVAPGVYHIVQRDALGNVLGMERVVIKR
jgi:hypothetical protein